MTRTYSVILVACGIVIAVCASAKLPEEGRTFPDTLYWALFGLAVAAVGLAVWHVSVFRARSVLATSKEHDASDPFSLINAIQEPVSELSASSKNADLQQLTDAIDDLISRFVIPFSERRQEVITRMGMRHGAEILVDYALGERLLNRAWSAAADGYAKEAVESLGDAAAAFAEAGQRAQEYA